MRALDRLYQLEQPTIASDVAAGQQIPCAQRQIARQHGARQGS
jgi:hypothetical protein